MIMIAVSDLDILTMAMKMIMVEMAVQMNMIIPLADMALTQEMGIIV